MEDPRVEAAGRVALLFGLDPLLVLAANRTDWTIRAAAARVAARELDRQHRENARRMGLR